ncbi:MAG: homoserine O-succinyltransferase [Fibrobacterota bacterium]
MTVVLPEKYHVKNLLENRKVECMTDSEAQKQDIRALRIGMLNIMPMAEKYEFNLLFSLGKSVLQIEPVWIKLKSHSYKSSDRDHLDSYYVDFEEAAAEGLDGLILTGAPVEHKKFAEINYWEEIRDILKYARNNIASTLGICWGGLALAEMMGLQKVNFSNKLFGVFEGKNLDRTHPVTGELDDLFYCPQSRHAGITDEEMEEKSNAGIIKLLAYSKEAGYFIFESSDGKYLAHLGHPEYNSGRLVEESARDKKAGREDVGPPVNFDPENPTNRWRGHRNEFFTQWIKYIYENTKM